MSTRAAALWCSLITAVVLISPTISRGDTESDCLKLIADTFCLGGNATDITVSGEVIDNSDDPQLQVTAYQLDDRRLRVASKDGRVVTISRLESPGSWINFTNWKKRIIRIYGQGEDTTTLPAYATSRSSRRNAINSKKGRAAMRWPQSGWQLELIWDNTDHLELRYSLAAAPQPDSEDL